MGKQERVGSCCLYGDESGIHWSRNLEVDDVHRASNHEAKSECSKFICDSPIAHINKVLVPGGEADGGSFVKVVAFDMRSECMPIKNKGSVSEEPGGNFRTQRSSCTQIAEHLIVFRAERGRVKTKEDAVCLAPWTVSQSKNRSDVGEEEAIIVLREEGGGR